MVSIEFYQVLAIFAQTSVRWPPAVTNLLKLLSAFNLNIEVVAPECLVPNLSYRLQFTFIMLLPIALSALFYLAYLFMAFNKRCVRGIRDRRKAHSHALFCSRLKRIWVKIRNENDKCGNKLSSPHRSPVLEHLGFPRRGFLGR